MKKLVIFRLLIMFYIALYFLIDSTMSWFMPFLKEEYAQIIGYFIYFIFFYMIIFFYLKQFDLYLFLCNFFDKNKNKNKNKDEDEDEVEIIDISKDDNDKWKGIILAIESTRHSSILSKIKDLDTENEINFPKYNRKYDFNVLFLHKIREFIILFENILEKLKHKELEKNQKYNEKNKKFIQDKLYDFYQYKYLFKVKLIAIKLFYYLVPYLILWFILKPINIDGKEDFINFFLGLGILIFAMPVLLLFNNWAQFVKIYLFKQMNMVFSRSLFLDVGIQILVTLIITVIILWGFNHLDINHNRFHDIFIFFQDIAFHTEFIDENLSNTYLLFSKSNISNYNILIAKIIIGIMGTIIILHIINVFIKEYDQFFYEQKIKRYLLPPELLKVLGFFFVFIIYVTYTYISVSSYPYTKNDINSTRPLVERNITQFVAMDNIAKAIEEKASFEDILPFGLFLALFGTLLSISSRDIMSNYFAGLSMKMNHPYEQGDRVKIGNSEILEVQEIGIRNDKFYEISSNSIISIPHSKLATSSIKNYTHPTLDYRQELSIYVKNSSPREAEQVLLVSAFINTGVKLPKIDEFIIKIIRDNKKIDLNIFERYTNEEYSKIDEYLNKNTNKIADKINITWQELSKINEIKDNNKKYFFKNLFIEKLPIDNSLTNTSSSILSIKKALIAIIASVIEYQEKIKNDFPCQSDKNGIRRKHMIFDKEDDIENKIKEFADILVDISFYYYMLANRLWELKEEQTTFSQKRKIDKAMTQILNVPRVTSVQELNDGSNYWKTTLFVTLELGEQCDETLHHINMYIDKIWNIFLEDDDTDISKDELEAMVG